MSQYALCQFGSLAGLERALGAELCTVDGVGVVKVIELRAALELGRRLVVAVPEQRPVIHCPRDVVNVVHSEMTLLEQEELWLLLLNSKNQILAIRRVYKGTVNSSAVRVDGPLPFSIATGCQRRANPATTGLWAPYRLVGDRYGRTRAQPPTLRRRAATTEVPRPCPHTRRRAVDQHASHA